MIFVLIPFIYFFFFSSSRRHTRSKRDWSSDVCSSDLAREAPGSARGQRPPCHPSRRARGRSEERRVGKGVDLGGRRIIKKKKKKRKKKKSIKNKNNMTHKEVKVKKE